MYIKNIHIKNYKGIKELTLELEPGVTLVIGDNGAGKTSILSALNGAMYILSVWVVGDIITGLLALMTRPKA